MTMYFMLNYSQDMRFIASILPTICPLQAKCDGDGNQMVNGNGPLRPKYTLFIKNNIVL